MSTSKIQVGERQFTLDWLSKNPDAAHHIYDKAVKGNLPVQCLCSRVPVPMTVVASAYLRTRNGWTSRHSESCPFYKGAAARPSVAPQPSPAPLSKAAAAPAADSLDATLNQLILLAELNIWVDKFAGRRNAHTVLERLSAAVQKLVAGAHVSPPAVLVPSHDRHRLSGAPPTAGAPTEIVSLAGLVDRCSVAKKGHVLRLAYEDQAVWLPPSLDASAKALTTLPATEHALLLLRLRPAKDKSAMRIAESFAGRYFDADWRLIGCAVKPRPSTPAA